MSFQLIFNRRYSMAHRLISGKSPQCEVPHGHNEYVEVTLQAVQPKELDGRVNMVTAFSNAKKRWHHFIDNVVDHSFQLNAKDPLLQFFRNREPEKLPRLMVMHGDPTTEMLCAVFMSKLGCFLKLENTNLECVKVKVEETPTNTVTLSGRNACEKHLPRTNAASFWWNRPDFSINDFKTEISKPSQVGVNFTLPSNDKESG